MIANKTTIDKKKIVIINGATRKKGNTDIILERIGSNIERGIIIDQTNLREKIIGDCIGCFNCYTKNKCSITDDMAGIYKKINNSDILIFASPIYWWGVTGLMKIFIDRLYFYYSSNNKGLISGKKAIIVSPMDMNIDIYKLKIFKDFYNILFENLDIELVDDCILGNINKKGEILKKAEHLEKVNSLTANLSIL